MKVLDLQTASFAQRTRYPFRLCLGVLLICAIWFSTAWAGKSIGPAASAEEEAKQAYQSISLALAADQDFIEYDTLMDVYQEMRSSTAPIPQIEELLGELIERRNAEPRVDQMVLIFAANILGNSQFPIPDAQALFERILIQDAERISYWVLIFLADAIGNYPVDLPGGDALVDRVQEWLARLDSEADVEKEYFGSHFLPPPKSRIIQAHLAGISEQRARQRERSAYYMLINGQVSEKTIVALFDYLGQQGLPGSAEIPRYPLAAMVENWQLLPDEIKHPQP